MAVSFPDIPLKFQYFYLSLTSLTGYFTFWLLGMLLQRILSCLMLSSESPTFYIPLAPSFLTKPDPWPHFQMTSEILHTLCIPIHAAFQLQFPLHVGLWLWPLLIHLKTPISVRLLSCTLYYWGSLENIGEATLWTSIHNLSWRDACWRETGNGPFHHPGKLKNSPVAGPRGWRWVASRVDAGQWPALYPGISNGSCFTSPSKIWLMGQSSLMASNVRSSWKRPMVPGLCQE